MVHWGSEFAARAGDRAAVGVAHVRDRLRRGRHRARGSHSGTDRSERRGLSPLGAERCLGQASRGTRRRQAPGTRERRRARALDAGDEGGLSSCPPKKPRPCWPRSRRVLPPSAARNTREDFANELVAPNPNLLAVSVRKRRAHYRVDACMVESTDIDTDAARSAPSRSSHPIPRSYRRPSSGSGSVAAETSTWPADSSAWSGSEAARTR